MNAQKAHGSLVSGKCNDVANDNSPYLLAVTNPYAEVSTALTGAYKSCWQEAKTTLSTQRKTLNRCWKPPRAARSTFAIQ